MATKAIIRCPEVHDSPVKCGNTQAAENADVVHQWILEMETTGCTQADHPRGMLVVEIRTKCCLKFNKPIKAKI
jgi:hypothetical protein